MESIPNVERPSSLERLSIYACPDITSVPHWIKFCTSLRQLHVSGCIRLISIDDDIFRSLIQLKRFTLGPFSAELEEFPALNSIHPLFVETLKIRGWPKLKSLPQQLQHLTALKKLIIWDFKGVETLPDWLANLSSLQQLELGHCDNLRNLPTTMKRLSNLTTLSSNGCPLLEQRYNELTGPDRHDISHIYICIERIMTHVSKGLLTPNLCSPMGKCSCRLMASVLKALPQFGILSNVRLCADCFNNSSRDKCKMGG